MRSDFSFVLDTSGDLPVLTVVAGRGTQIPDYRSYSGVIRRALQEFSVLREQQSRFFPWDQEIADSRRSVLDPGGRMIAVAAASGLLRDASGKPLISESDSSRVEISVVPKEDGSFTLRPALPESLDSDDGKGEPEGGDGTIVADRKSVV